MDLVGKLLVIILWYVFFVTSTPIKRIKRAGGRVEITQLIRPPSRLKKHETPYPPPGWTHCIKKAVATNHWRAIGSKQGIKFQTAQFQCTWMISIAQSGISSHYNRIQISVQKLELGNQNDRNCLQNFLEIVDAGKSQGRFCDKHRPADYVTIGNHIRLDIQGEDTLAKLVRTKGRSPFVISYRAVTESQPGFRSFITKAKNIVYDRYHPPSRGFGGSLSQRPTKGTTRDKEKADDDDLKEEEDQFGSLGLAGVIALAVCGTVVILVILLMLARRCCESDKEKADKKQPNFSSSEETNCDDPSDSYSKPIGLPGHSYVQLGQQPSLATKNEVIISSEIVRPSKPRKSTSHTAKEKSAEATTNQPEEVQSKTIDKVVKAKTTTRRRHKGDIKGIRETKRKKVVSRPLIRQRHHNSKRTQAKKHSSQNKDRKRKTRRDPSKEELKERSKSPEKKVRHQKKSKRQEESDKKKTDQKKEKEDWPLRRHPNPKKSLKKSEKKEKKKASKDCDLDQQVKKRKSKKRTNINQETPTKTKENSSAKRKSKKTRTQCKDANHDSNSTGLTPRTRYKSKSKSRKAKSRNNNKT